MTPLLRPFELTPNLRAVRKLMLVHRPGKEDPTCKNEAIAQPVGAEHLDGGASLAGMP